MKGRGRRAGRRRSPSVDSDDSFSPSDESVADEVACDASPILVDVEMSCCGSDDESPLLDELFDVEPDLEDSAYKTDLTDNNNVDPDNLELLCGNDLDPEDILRSLAEFEEADFNSQDYSDSTTSLIDRTGELFMG